MHKVSEQTFFQKAIQMVIRYMEKLLLIREIQMKSTMRCHLIPVGMAAVRKARDEKCWQRYGEKGDRVQFQGSSSGRNLAICPEQLLVGGGRNCLTGQPPLIYSSAVTWLPLESSRELSKNTMGLGPHAHEMRIPAGGALTEMGRGSKSLQVIPIAIRAEREPLVYGKSGPF